MSEEQVRVERTLGSWRRIETWLKQHVPRAWQRLPEPATEEEILALERDLDLKIPADVRAFYLVRNGTGPAGDFNGSGGDADPSGYIFTDYGIGPISQLSIWARNHFPPDIFEGTEFSPSTRLLPLIVFDPDAWSMLFVDCTPGDGYGQLGWFGEASFPDMGLYPSFADYLLYASDALSAGRDMSHHRPEVR
ncbi:SMI1/KNR4 family protein [Streptomyces sp. NEAU-YJ-81]|uniref:SMI1/KNR4 family protein n=1 Tax=Streptomyces sp. NEAU-YJ-81 TaxID=2820288 RepID=UPI001ABCE5D7|nr:SMI1/KNR4 family protein [Streptomyces sp. NEAU-YJ-81]MBO3679244.1 SMI1/KNR4 family protein [Streptomyces sp. NEAU-YJ-81]